MIITGNEPYFATPSTSDEAGMSCGNGNEGATLRQVALKDFMCAIIQCNEYSIVLQDADMIEDLNGKYIKSGNVYTYASGYVNEQVKKFTIITTGEQRIAREAELLTTAYINQLNK